MALNNLPRVSIKRGRTTALAEATAEVTAEVTAAAVTVNAIVQTTTDQEVINLNPVFSYIYLSAVLSLIGFELFALRRGKKGETITQHWKWVNLTLSQEHKYLGWAWKGVTAFFFSWLIAHFLSGGAV